MVKGMMIFILNLNLTSFNFKNSWLFNMVSKLGLTLPLCNLLSFVFVSSWKTLFNLFDSPSIVWSLRNYVKF